MPSGIELLALAAGAGLLLKKSGAPASSASPASAAIAAAVTTQPAAASSPIGQLLNLGPTAPHLQPGAQILSDEEIAAQIDTVHGAIHGGTSIKNAVMGALACECLSSIFNPSGCKGQPPAHAVINTLRDGTMAISIAGSAGLISGIAAPFASGGIAAGGGITLGSVLGAATFGIGIALGVFGAIYAHHAQAVAQEQRILCASVPSVNEAFAAIEDAVTSGRVTPANGQQLLAQLFQEFDQTVAPIRKMDNSHCNAACVWTRAVQAIVIKKQNRYSQLV